MSIHSSEKSFEPGSAAVDAGAGIDSIPRHDQVDALGSSNSEATLADEPLDIATPNTRGVDGADALIAACGRADHDG